METDCISFQDTAYFSKIILDYLEGDEKLHSFYQYEPKLESFAQAMENKNFPAANRIILQEALEKQYSDAKIKLNKFEAVQANVTALKEENTYTITTGHQVCLFTGPLYFIYKIISTIKLCRDLKVKYPEKHFVPVLWMATEDHDFEEVNHFRLNGKKYIWKTDQKGAVGRMLLDGLEEVYEAFSADLGMYNAHAEQLKSWFEKAYLKHDNLAHASRFLANELFAEYGLLIVDGDDAQLKKLFAPIIEKELLEEFSAQAVEKQSQALAQHYKLQVNPREINLFYLSEGSRNRILKVGDDFVIHEKDQRLSEKEVLKELEEHPENFSPNVLLRPVYQETILPNLAYIGGGGELAYWFQLKSTFEEINLPFPMLLLRNSVLWMPEKESKYFNKLNISLKQLFQEEGALLKEWVKQNADQDLSLQQEKDALNNQFEVLRNKAAEIDQSLNDHVAAAQRKQEKAIELLSEKMIRAERRQQGEAASRIKLLKTNLFPNGGLQERSVNFSEIYLKEGREALEIMLDSFEIPTANFMVFRQ